MGDFTTGLSEQPHSSQRHFSAICAVTQLAMDNGQPLFTVEYDDIKIE